MQKKWKKQKQEKDADVTVTNRSVYRSVCMHGCVCVSTHFLTFLTFMLAVLLLQERMRGSALSSGISALLA